MTGRSTNQVDMSILPGVEEYPLRLMRSDVNDSAITNNHGVDEFIARFSSWYGCTDDAGMRCPSREADCVQLNIPRGHADRRSTGQSWRSSAPEPMNNPSTHRVTNTRSCSTENTKSLSL